MEVSSCQVCRHFSCVCTIQSRHSETCKFRIAATTPVGIACNHGRDVCPTCDACTCAVGVTRDDLGSQALLDRWAGSADPVKS